MHFVIIFGDAGEENVINAHKPGDKKEVKTKRKRLITSTFS